MLCSYRCFQVLRESVQLSADMDVLEFGCGTGQLATRLEDSVRSILGVDVSTAMLNQFRRKLESGQHPKLRCIQLPLTDANSLAAANSDADPYPLAFDLIVSVLTLHHVEDIKGAWWDQV